MIISARIPAAASDPPAPLPVSIISPASSVSSHTPFDVPDNASGDFSEINFKETSSSPSLADNQMYK